MCALYILVLLLVAVVTAQSKPAPASENGAAIVVNNCSFLVYYKSVGNHTVLLSIIAPGDSYIETYRLNIVNRTLNPDGTVDGTLGSVSIKLASNQTIGEAANESDAFDASIITQFEYTYNPNRSPRLWYDVSNVNGYLNLSESSWPFDIYRGLNITGTSSEYPTLVCPPDNATCSAAYTHWDDN